MDQLVSKFYGWSWSIVPLHKREKKRKIPLANSPSTPLHKRKFE